MDAPAFGALTAELRRAEADGYDVDQVLPALVSQRGLDDADDPAAVIHHRLAHATRRTWGLPGSRRSTTESRIAGLIPIASGPMTHEYRQALDERADLIEARTTELVHRARRDGEAWIKAIGPEPRGRRSHDNWHTACRVIAAYRDRYGITGAIPIGTGSAATTAQAADEARAAAALHAATTSPPDVPSVGFCVAEPARGDGIGL